MSEEHIQTPVDHAAGTEIQPAAAPAGSTAPVAKDEKGHPVSRDSFREVVETVVFVIVLVLLLKTFVAEAFVIPTGSMATTLLGNHLDVECPQCKYRFIVNASSELDDPTGLPHAVQGCTCENCGYHINKEELDQILGRP
jgi:signal peptidase I